MHKVPRVVRSECDTATELRKTKAIGKATEVIGKAYKSLLSY